MNEISLFISKVKKREYIKCENMKLNGKGNSYKIGMLENLIFGGIYEDDKLPEKM